MSWLGTLESLLDRVDQAAGQALKDSDEMVLAERSSTRAEGLHSFHDWPATSTRPTAVVAASAYSSVSPLSQISSTPSSAHQRVPVCGIIYSLI